MADFSIIVSEMKKARELATPDISGYAVGCVIEDIFGRLFIGSNSEYENRCAGLCAESAAIANMCSSVGATRLKNIYLCGAPKNNLNYNEISVPCGLCRQRIAEIADADTKLLSLGQNGSINFECNFFELMPKPFIVEGQKWVSEYINQKREPLVLKKGDDISERLIQLKDLSFPLSGKKEALIIELATGELLGGNYFGTACYKADIDAETSAYAKVAALRLWNEIKKIHNAD